MSRHSYELRSGEVLEGRQADIMEMLDRIDPLSDRMLMSLTDEETLQEFERFERKMMWCPELACTVIPSTIDGFAEVPGDTVISERLTEFNVTRRRWALERIDEAMEDGDKAGAKQASAYLRHVSQSLGAGRHKALVSAFKGRHEVHQERLNAEPTYVGTWDGVVDMATGLLRYRTRVLERDIDGTIDAMDAREAMVTKKARAAIDFDQHPHLERDGRWERFVLEVMDGDEEMAGYLQRALGYSLLGGNPEEVMFVAHGPSTRNGKSTLLNSVAHALGDYAASVSSGFLLAKAGTQAEKDEVATLPGKRVVIASEPPRGKRLDEAALKAYSGNDPIVTSRKYGNTFTFEPQFTMWLMCNDLPEVGDTTVFASGRIKVVPFTRHFAASEQDIGLKQRFRTEEGMHTIFAWLLDGYQDYLERGLDEPRKVTQATAIWARTADDFDRFLDERCWLDPSAKVEVKELQGAYKAWCKRNGVPPELSSAAITKRLKKRSVVKYRGDREYFYRGVRLQRKKGGKEAHE